MREEYIRLVKEYILSKPDYKHTIQQIKVDLLTLGATKEELHEALRQLGIPEEVSTHLSTKKRVGDFAQKIEQKMTFKRLLELDIAAHGVLVIGMFAFAFGIYMTLLNLPPGKKPEAANLAQKIDKKETTSVDNALIPRVYANSVEIDAQKVFSYPASDLTLAISGTPKKEIYGFFPYWMIETEDKITFNMLTTIALFGLEVDGSGNIITVKQDNSPDGGWEMWNNPKLNNVINRAKKRKAKVELVIKAFNSENIEKLVVSDEAQRTFISNLIQLVNLKTLDGINLDFEYLGESSKEVTDGFTRLVTNLRVEMKRQLPNSTLTVDTYISQASIPRLIDITALESQVDAFVIMGYDFHTPRGDAGPIAPMEGSYSMIGFMQSYLEKVAPEKLILAVPYYGYDWAVPSVSDEAKTLPYAQIAADSKLYDIQWDDTAQTPFYKYIDPETKKTREVHYENTRSLGIKYDFINSKNLRGVGIWALGYDGLNGDLRTLLIEKFAE